MGKNIKPPDVRKLNAVEVSYFVPTLDRAFRKTIPVEANRCALEQVKEVIAAEMRKWHGQAVRTILIETVTRSIGRMRSTLTVNSHVLIEDDDL